MSSIWGNKFKLSLFGESHGSAIGVVIDGIPPGTELNEEFIRDEMARRAPGNNADNLATPRNEKDEYEILSGVFQGRTTGTPLCTIIRNNDTRSKDYNDLKNTPRPGHADYSGMVKYKGMNDPRGGGHFSARITAGLVFAGALAKTILQERDISIGAHIKSIYTVKDEDFENETLNVDTFNKLRKMRIPVLNESKIETISELIQETAKDGDSVGGVIEAAIIGLPAGVGAPIFDSVESKLAHILYSLPGVKGVEFGAGFDITTMKGSEANDPFFADSKSGNIRTKSNNNGGINGGITNGMPIVFKVALKPTPSIAKSQRTIDIMTGKETEINIKGRHDPCIAVRGVSVIEAAAAICMLDLLLEGV